MFQCVGMNGFSLTDYEFWSFSEATDKSTSTHITNAVRWSSALIPTL